MLPAETELVFGSIPVALYPVLFQSAVLFFSPEKTFAAKEKYLLHLQNVFFTQ